jgi:NADPH:quinone reductase-like Zn-dependent oxidoreductase
MAGNEFFKPKNVAAWALKPKDRPLVVSKAPYTSPPENHVTIQVVDAAVNPIDWIMQDEDLFGIDYPNVFGQDIAGEIIEVGDKVDEFKIGQRVIAFVLACDAAQRSTLLIEKQALSVVHRPIKRWLSKIHRCPTGASGRITI